MSAVLLVAAEQLELDGIVKRLTSVRRLDWGLPYAVEGRLGPARIVAVANGPGPRLAAEALATACDRTAVQRVVSTGFCGALDPSLPLGGIVTQTDRLVSIDRVAVTARDKLALARNGALAVEMEYAGVAREASRRGLPCSAVRVVSDEAMEALPLDFNRYRKPDGRFDRAAIACAAIVRPWKIVALLRFQRNCKLASAKLGEFFATCDF